MNDESLFHQALEQSAQERAAFLDEACGGDEARRRRVEALLQAHDNPGSFLQAPAVQLSETTDSNPQGEGGPNTVEEAAPGEVSRKVVGPYKLLQQIGEGGMGAVWMAEQTQPVRRKVALKIIKAGMDTRQVLARFEAERQALALMDHPNIARVLDAGTTPEGRPYFAMELVKGQPITKYCDEQRLTPRQRLELFVSVCQAIQHAHQKGIIHRDIKPSNVLVASYDGRPVVKVIDFGIAKATGQQLTEKTLVTEIGSVVGTLEYMSPEQAELNQLDIDTRSDIYSLGVLLYELLTGTTPLERKHLQAVALLEVLRLIREEEPPRPSTRLSTTEELPSIASNRGLEARKLSGLVRGELDWIVMRALEKDRNRRYETANSFAADVQRYLNDEPVLACPPSVRYRFGKFARRYRRVLAMAAVVSLAALVALGAIAGTVGWVLNDRQVRQATLEENAGHKLDEAWEWYDRGNVAEAQTRARQAKEMVGGTGSPDLRARLEQTHTDLETVACFEKLRNERALLQIDVRMDLVGRVANHKEVFQEYGVPVLELEHEEAVRRIKESRIRVSLIAALDDWASMLGNLTKGQNTEWRKLLAIARDADADAWQQRCRGVALRGNGVELKQLAEQPEAFDQGPAAQVLLFENLVRRDPAGAVKFLKQSQLRHPGDFWINQNLSFFLMNSSLLGLGPDRPDEIISYSRAALAACPDSPGMLVNLSVALLLGGQADEAIAACDEVLRHRPNFLRALGCRGEALRQKGEFDKAIAAFRQALDIDPDNPVHLVSLGKTLGEKGQYDEAIATFNKAVRASDKPNPVYAESDGMIWVPLRDFIGASGKAVRNRYKASAYHGLGVALHKKGQLDAALDASNKAIQSDPDDAKLYVGLGLVLISKKRMDEGFAAIEKAIKLEPDSAAAHGALGHALNEKGRPDEAIVAYQRAIALRPNHALTQYALGDVLLGRGRVDEAIAAFSRSLKIKPEDARVHYSLGLALARKGKLDEAIPAFNNAIALKPDHAQAYSDLGEALQRQERLDEAIAAYQKAIDLKLEDSIVYFNLGLALNTRRRFNEATSALNKSIALKSDRAAAHQALGRALGSAGRLEESVPALRKAVALDRTLVDSHFNLGVALVKLGRLQEAVAVYQELIQVKPDHAEAHSSLGHLYGATGRPAEAIAAYQKAIALDRGLVAAHFNLGVVYQKQGKLDEAVAAYRQTILLKPDHAMAHANLGSIFLQQGRFAEGLAARRLSNELGSKDPNWRFPSARYVREAERLVELDGRLPAVLKGEVAPVNSAERLEFARVCYFKRLYAAAARLSDEAFAGKVNQPAGQRYDAACSAALAGCGQGEDAASLDEAARVRWRNQARAWLRDELELAKVALKSSSAKSRAAAQDALRHWQGDPDLAGLRDAEKLAKLPEAERPPWREFWAEVAKLLEQADKDKPKETNPKPKP
jgi:tetratricopeptide (TPR) repeat protein/serine/threonine protein kinase